MLSRVVSAHRSRWVGGGATTTTITTAGIVRRLLVTHRVTHLVSQPGPTGAAALAGTFNAQEVANTLWAYAPYRGAEGHVHDVGARDGTLIVRSILCCTLIPLALGPQTSGKRHGLPGA